eukprot:CFRG5349T1
MPVQVWENGLYVAIRCGMWAILFGASFLDFLIHKGEKVHGWQLHRAIMVTLVVVLIKEILILIWVHTSREVNPVFLALLVFWNLADASFQALLMTIAYGYQITKDRFSADGAKAVFIAPVFYFASITTHNIIWANHGGLTNRPFGGLSDSEENVLVIATLIYLFTVIYMWTWIFQTTQIEVVKLEAQLAAHRNENTPELDDLSTGRAMSSDATANVDVITTAEGHTVMDGEEEIVTDRNHEQKDNMDVLGEQDEDQFEGTTANEPDNVTMPVAAKLRLISRFFWCVTLYFFASMLTIVISTWDWDDLASARAGILVVHNALYYIFMAGLCWIFRLREANPYFVLGGDYDTSIWDEENEERDVHEMSSVN